MAVNYFLDKRPNKEGELPIRVQINVKGAKMLSTFGISVDPAVWSGSRVPKGTYRNSRRLTGAEINRRLNNIENHFLDWDNQLTRRPTKDEFKEQLDKALNKEETTAPAPTKKARKKSFFQLLDEFVKEQGAVQQWAYATKQCFVTFQHHMEGFKKDVTLEYFDETGINKFVTYLRQKKGLEDNSVRKQYKNLLWFVNWALRKGYTMPDTVSHTFFPYNVPSWTPVRPGGHSVGPAALGWPAVLDCRMRMTASLQPQHFDAAGPGCLASSSAIGTDIGSKMAYPF